MTAAPKVLISDKMSPLAEEIFKSRGITVDVRTGLTPDVLKQIIGEYDGLAIRSSTKVTADILSASGRLRVIGRAGIGVDNVDVPSATNHGVIVMNTPFGNSITTAEHAIAMMFALARQIPAASASTHAGKWEKNKFMGQEIFGKTLGVIGCGNIGSIVADRAVGLKMRVIAYDPFLSEERAVELGVTKGDLDDIFKQSDFITLHTPLIESTRNIINKDSIAKMKKGVRIINCARGGLVNEADLKDALDSGHVAGAALDVFEVEPAENNILFGHENVVCTPHLGASTTEAQENVALQVAEQMSDYLLTGAVANAVNMPSISAEDAPRLKPYLTLAEKLGRLAGQLADGEITDVAVTYQGDVAALKVKALTSVVLAGLLQTFMEGINSVNAPAKLKERGIALSETVCDDADDLHSRICVELTTKTGNHSVGGTLFSGAPRIMSIDGVAIESEFSPSMVFIRNFDKPGLIGRLGTLLGDAGVNIAGFKLGRREDQANGEALGLITVDGSVSDHTLKAIIALDQIKTAKTITV